MKSNLTLLVFLFISSYTYAQYDVYDTDLFFSTAEMHVSKSEYKQAIKQYTYVHESDPRYIEAQQQVAYIHLADEAYDEAIKFLLPFYDAGKFKEDPQFYVILGTAYSSNDQLEEAEKIYKEGESVTPNYGTLMYNLAVLYSKKEDFDKTLHYLKRTFDTNPNITSSHYLLSNMAFENGKIGLGCLAALAYLANEPNGRYSGDMILAINEKMGSNYLDETSNKFSKKGDDFSGLDFILRNEFPLDAKYKLKCEIDDVYTRHTQAILEYASEHKIKDGYFENIYIPFLADINNKKFTEHFQYWTLQMLTGDISKTITKNKDKITEFSTDYYQKDFWDIYSKRTVTLYGEEKKVNFYLENNIPYIVCVVDDSKIIGDAMFVDEYGRKSAKVFYDKSDPEGEAEYYDSDGKVTKVRNYKDGKINGDETYYNDAGDITAVYPYKNGEVDGIVKTYYPNGDVSCTVRYTNGVLDGVYNCNYENGAPKFKVNYRDGKINGEKYEYEPDGTLTAKEIFKDDFYEGICKYYNPANGEQTATVKYSKGDPVANYTRKGNEGFVEFEYIENGEKDEAKYYDDGALDNIKYFEKDKIVKQEFYENGNKYITQNYKKEKLASIIQYTAKTPKGKKVDISKAKISNYEGVPISNLRFVDGELEGHQKYFYANGNTRSEITYNNGKETGLSKFYNNRGGLKRTYNIESDTLKGIYTSYNSGILYDEYHYNNGSASGPFKIYWENGKTKYTGFYYQNDEHGETVKTRTDGSTEFIQEYEYGDQIKTTFYDLDGNVDGIKDYTKEGKQTIKYKSRPYVEKYSLKNGKLDGLYTRVTTSGDTLFSLNYINGKRNGRCTYYSPSGNIRTVTQQKYNKNQGLIEHFDDYGTLYSKTTYVDNDEYGEETYFYPNGAKRLFHNNIDNKIEGESIVYNMKEEAVAKIYYNDGLLESYWVIGQEEGTKLPLSNSTVEGKYANGKTAVRFSTKKKLFDGEFATYAEDGKSILISNYSNGILDGNRTFYRENGKKYQSIDYTNGDRNGKTIYYDEKEQVAIQYENKSGNLYGDYQIYEDGKLINTKVYFDDELIQIK